MELKTIQEAVNTALKAHEMIEVDTLRGVIANIKKTAIDKQIPVDEKLVDEILLKEQKTIQEMIDTCPKDRIDLLEKYNHQKIIIDNFAPVLETNATVIEEMVIATLAKADVEAKTANKGQIMKTVMPVLKGKVDMTVANKVITDLIK